MADSCAIVAEAMTAKSSARCSVLILIYVYAFDTSMYM